MHKYFASLIMNSTTKQGDKHMEILTRENATIKGKALNIINHSDFYTKEEIKRVYENVSNDNRLSQKTRMELLDGLRKEYKRN